MGYADSANLYAFAKGDPINHRDPTGNLCETANASGVLNWLGRCAEDLWNVEVDYHKGVFAPSNAGKNLKRIEGGVRSTEKLVKNTVVGTAKFAADFATMSVSDAAADRMVTRGQAVGDFIDHPIDTIVNAHNSTADRILAAEQRGDYIASGEAAAGTAQADFLAVYGATALGRAALTRIAPSVAFESSAYSSGWFARNPLLVSEGAAAGSAETLFFKGSFYEVLAEQSISGLTRAAHRGAANRGLLAQLEADESFARGMSAQFDGINVADFMKSGKGALRNPPGTQWHHPFDNPSVMRLLRRTVHNEPTLQNSLHPDGSGGFANFYGN